jgi:hypothetical protein
MPASICPGNRETKNVLKKAPVAAHRCQDILYDPRTPLFDLYRVRIHERKRPCGLAGHYFENGCISESILWEVMLTPNVCPCTQ